MSLPTRPPRRLGAVVLALMLGLTAACGSGAATDEGASSDTSGGSSAHFPVSIEHAFGATEVTEKPENIVTLGWGTTDSVLAMGEVPVGMEKQQYGGNENDVLPWVAEKLDEMGAETPTLLPTTTEGDIAYEKILALEPDVILAQYSGITEKQYEKLSKIAPTVAYPKQPWATSMEKIVTMSGQALGTPDRAREVLDEIDRKVAEAAEDHPEFEGTTIATLKADTTQMYTYTRADPREQVLRQLGFETAPSVKRLSKEAEEGAFYVPFSFERADQLTSDVLLVYSDSKQAHDQLTGSAPFRSMTQVEAGTVASVVGTSEVAAVSPPTALSLVWGLERLVSSLSEAAKQAS